MNHNIFLKLPENNHGFDCLMKTSKDIRNIAVKLDSANYIQVVQILEKFGGKVCKFYLKLMNKFSIADIQTLFSLVSNASDVRFYAKDWISDCYGKAELLKFPGDLLEEAEFSSLNLQLITHQTKIKKLRLVTESNTQISLNRLQLKDLTITSSHEYWDNNLHSDITVLTEVIVSKYNYDDYVLTATLPSLKNLCLKDVLTDQQLKEIIQKFPNLETFSLRARALTVNGIQMISNLKQLVELKVNVHECGRKIFKTLAGMNHSRLRKLEIYADEIDEKDIRKLSQNTPNIKELTINCKMEETFHAVLRDFRQLKSLSLFVIFHHNEAYNSDALFKDSDRNENLKQLYLADFLSCSSKRGGKNIVKTFPNLERISFCEENIGKSGDISMLYQFRLMLITWKNLTHLTWVCLPEHVFIESDLEFILDHGHKLQFVMIEQFKKLNVQRTRRMFGEKFGIIQFKDQKLIMARDLKTLAAECTIEKWIGKH